MTNPPPFGLSTPAVVLRVIDGDTLEAEIRRVLSVRLLDCWAPETRGGTAETRIAGLAAKARLSELAHGRDAVLHIPGSNRGSVADIFTFGRVLGSVWIDGVNVASALVAEGYATQNKE